VAFAAQEKCDGGGADEVDDGSGDDHDAGGGDSRNIGMVEGESADNDVDGKDSPDDADGEIVDDAEGDVGDDVFSVFLTSDNDPDKAYLDASVEKERATKKPTGTPTKPTGTPLTTKSAGDTSSWNNTYWTETRALPETPQAKPTAASSKTSE
jgi:hypothetical protein